MRNPVARYLEARRRGWAWVRRYWPVIGVAILIAGFSWIVGQLAATQNKNDRQQDDIAAAAHDAFVAAQAANAAVAANKATADANRRLVCAITQAITANPIVRIPQFETEKEFRRRVHAMRVIVRQAHGIDCRAVLAGVEKGGGVRPNQGNQLPRGGRVTVPPDLASPAAPAPPRPRHRTRPALAKSV